MFLKGLVRKKDGGSCGVRSAAEHCGGSLTWGDAGSKTGAPRSSEYEIPVHHRGTRLRSHAEEKEKGKPKKKTGGGKKDDGLVFRDRQTSIPWRESYSVGGSDEFKRCKRTWSPDSKSGTATETWCGGGRGGPIQYTSLNKTRRGEKTQAGSSLRNIR